MYVSLMSADHPIMRRSRWYNSLAANRLSEAYQALDYPTPLQKHYERAFDLATQSLHLQMSAPQRILAYWVRARVHTALGNNDAAIEDVEEALFIAGNLADEPVLMKLLAHRGRLHFHRQRLRKARDDFEASLYHFHYFGARPTEQSRAFEATLNRQLATALVYLADPHEAEWRLEFARQILPHTLPYRLEALAIDNIQAILYRMQGRAERGINLATQAAEAYSDIGDPASAARLHNGVAELALDRAETCGDFCYRFVLMKLATEHNGKAYDLASAQQDEGAMLMAVITRARGDRLSHLSPQRRFELNTVVRRAEKLHDVPLQCQALKVLAEDYMATGEVIEARECYRRTLEVLRGTDLPALGVWALRELA